MTRDSNRHPGQAVVYTRMTDGLGNQLFQYAAGRALAERLSARLVLDCGWYLHHADRAFELDAYAIEAERDWTPRTVRRRWFKLPTRLGKRVADVIHDRIPVRVRIEEHSFPVFHEKQIYRYDGRFGQLSGSVYLSGWWQSPRYFESASGVIRDELRLKPASGSGAAAIWRDRIRAANAVAVHIRRGDYLRSSDRWTCSKDYYDKAIERVRARVSDPHFFIFSDDEAWCRENFAFGDATIVESHPSQSPVHDLALMASCRHHIIANSSFSWWGAWLAESAGQIVVAPENWVVGLPTTDDFVARRWPDFLRL